MKMQTLAQVNAKATYEFDPRLIGLKRPTVRSRITNCVSTWAIIEALTAQVVAYALKGDVRIAVEMFMSITSAPASAAVLKTAVRLGLPRQYAELFNAIWIIGGLLAEERHKLVHWMIGYSPEISNALLLLNPRDGLRRLSHNVSVGRTPDLVKFQPRPLNAIRVVSVQYLDHLTKELQQHLDQLREFVRMLAIQSHGGWDDALTEREYRQLCNEPRILQILTQERGKAQKNKRATRSRLPLSKRPPKPK